MHEDHFIGNLRFTKVDKSRPPLRWIANALGSWSIFHLLRSVDSYEQGKDKIGKFHSILADSLMKPYNRWGTFYKSNFPDDFDI